MPKDHARREPRLLQSAILALALFSASLPIPIARADTASIVIPKVLPKLTATLAAKGFVYGAPIFIRIFKETSELEVWIKKGSRFELFYSYHICYYSGSLGPKQRQGDWQAPEGFYEVSRAQLNPSSNYHLAFNIGYPNAYDRAYKRTGGDIMVHGNCVSVGCFAMTDKGIEEIYALAQGALEHGQSRFSVHIFPFRMTPEAVAGHGSSPHVPFWKNLEEGYSAFERSGVPPLVGVKNAKYVFSPGLR